MSESMLQVQRRTQLLIYPFWQRGAARTGAVGAEQDSATAVHLWSRSRSGLTGIVIVLCC